MTSYSQDDEQAVIDEIVRSWPMAAGGSQARRFLDIGAFDGIRYSNTRFLALAGWSGVCVEPSPVPFAKLARLYRGNPRIALVNALMGVDSKLVKFWSSPDAVSTSDAAHHAKWKKAVRFQEVWIPELPLAAFLIQFPGPYDLVNIDCEGEATARVYFELATRDFTGARIVCVEWNSVTSLKRQMVQAARTRGMRLLHSTSKNLVFSR